MPQTVVQVLPLLTRGARVQRLPERLAVFVEGPTPGSRGPRVPAQRVADTLVFRLAREHSGRSLYVVPEPKN